MANVVIRVTNRNGTLVQAPGTNAAITNTNITVTNLDAAILRNDTGPQVASQITNFSQYLTGYSNTAQMLANDATTYANAVSFTTSQGYITSSALAPYQTSAGLAANVLVLTSNNANFFGGVSLSTINTAITSNAATAYSNAVSYVGSQSFVNSSQLSSNLSTYQTTAGLSANVITLTSNAASFLGNSSGTLANVASWITGNATSAYSNAITVSGNAAQAYANAVANAAALYQTTAGLSANVATLAANSATYHGNSSGTLANVASWITGNAATAFANAIANAASNAAGIYQTTAGLAANVATLTANSATYHGNSSGTLANVASWITGNAATAYTNAIATSGNAAQAYANAVANAAALYQTTAGLSANVLTLTSNSTNFVGSVSAANVVSNAQLSGNLTNYAALSGATFTGQVNATQFNASGNVSIGGNLTLTGNLYAIGNSFIVNSTIITSNDMVLILANGAGTSAIANGAGLAIGSYANFAFNNSTTSWQSNIAITPSTNNLLLGSASNLWALNANTVNAITITIGGVNVNTAITGNAATAYANAVANAAALYQTTAGLSANVATLTANAATYHGNSSGTLANVASWITGNAATAFANAIANAASNAAGIYQTTAGLSANVATLTSNATTYLGNSSGTIANVVSWITGNAATAFANAIANAASNAAGIYQTSAGLSANIAAYLPTYTGIVNGSSFTIGTNAIVNSTVFFIGNSTTNATTNSTIIRVIDAGNNFTVNSSQATFGNSAVYSQLLSTGFNKSTANGYPFIFNGAGSNNASNPYWNGYHFAPSAILANSTLSNAFPRLSHYYSYSSTNNPSDLYWNIVAGNDAGIGTGIRIRSNSTAGVQSGIDIVANGNVGVATTAPAYRLDVSGDIRASANIYGTLATTLQPNITANNANNLNSQPASYYTNATNITTGILPYAQLGANVVNTSAAFTITGMQTYSNGITFSNTITANGSNGSAGQVLTSSGATGNVYWSTVYSSFTNGQSISVNNFVIVGNLTANSSNGTAGQLLTSNGSGVYWSSPSAASVNTDAQYTWSNTQTFTNTITFSSQLQVGANVIANTTTIFVGNSSVNTNITADTILLNGVNVNTAITSNAATAYSNAVTYIGAQSFVNTSQLSSNLLNYALLSGGLFTGSVNATSYTVGTTFIANATNILVGGTGTSNGVNVNTTTIFIGNSSVSATINATSFSGTASNATNLNSQPGSYYTNATNITTGTLPYAQMPANVVYWSNTNTFTANQTFSTNTTFTASIFANTVNAASFTTGSLFSANSTLVNAVALNVQNQINTATLYATTSANIASIVQANSSGVYVGANVIANTTTFFVGNTTSAFFTNSTVQYVGNSTQNTSANSSYLRASNGLFLSPQTSVAPNTSEGSVFYDITNHALNVYADDPSTPFEIGQQQVVRVVNKTGATLNFGAAVYLNGVQGNRPTVALAVASSSATYNVIGCVLSSSGIAVNAEGFVLTSGLLQGYNTSAMTAGAVIYLDPTTPGALTTTEPQYPNYNIAVGQALNSTNNGKIYLSIVPNYLAGMPNTAIAISNGTLLTYSNSFTFDYANNVLHIGNSSSNAAIGYANAGGSYSYIQITGNANTSIEESLTNANNGANASSDMIVYDNYGITSSNYLDVGINSNNFSLSTWTINGPSDGYVYTANTNLSVGTQGANYLNFFTGNTLIANERMRITAIGNVGIGNTAPDATLHVQGTANVTGNVVVVGSFNAANVTASLFTGNVTGTASNATNLNSQPGSYYTNATNITTGILPYAQLGANVVNTSANFTITGMQTYSNGITFSNTITANASNGTAGQVLTSSGSTGNVYWSTISGVNTAAQYTFSNTITFSGNLTSSGWVNLKTYVETASAPTISGSALTLDLSNSSVFNVNLNSSITTLSISNAPATGNAVSGFVLIFTATGTAYTVVWPSSTPNVRWANGVAPTITSTNNKRDVYVFFTTDNGSTYNAFISGQNI